MQTLRARADRAIVACKPSTSCVSSASFRSPSQYMPPWSYGSAGKAQAFHRLHSQLQEMQQQGSAQVLTVDADAGYIAARIRYSLAGERSSLHWNELQRTVAPHSYTLAPLAQSLL